MDGNGRRELPKIPEQPRPASVEELIGRLDLLPLRELLGMDEEDIRQVLAMLVAGRPKAAVGHTFGITFLKMAEVCDYIGWGLHWRIKKQTVGAMTVEEVKKRYNAGETNEAIAKIAGVSRERVRQVVEREGLRPRLELIHENRMRRAAESQAEQEQKKQASRERKAAQLAKLTEDMAEAQRLWAQGASRSEIAKAYGQNIRTMDWQIHRARKFLGPEWFPYRKDPITGADLGK